MEPRSHWAQVDTADVAQAVSGHQPHATPSRRLIFRIATNTLARGQ